jgi:thiol-disulfide isomerase/thioredoxin
MTPVHETGFGMAGDKRNSGENMLERRSSAGFNGGNGLLLLGLLAMLGATGCRDVPDLPAAGPYPDQRPPVTVEPGFLEYSTPSESLYVHPLPEDERLSLLFYRGRGVARDASGAAYVSDAGGSRVLVIDEHLTVTRTVGGPSPEQGPLGLPLSVAPTADGAVFVVDVEHPEGLLYFDEDGSYVGAAEPPMINGNVRADPQGFVWAARSPYILGFEPTDADQPLLYRFDPLAGEGVGIASIEPAEAPIWNRLANAGSIAIGPDGQAYFAYLLRNEIRAYTPEGDLLWRVRRSLPFESLDGIQLGPEEDQVRMRPVTQALAVGPDRLLYALTATDPPAQPGQEAAPDAVRRIEAYDPATGRLLRATTVPASWATLAADEDGRIYRADPVTIDASAPPPERAQLPAFSFDTFAGEAATFEEYRGKALLVNVWASWCGPCREELPRLKEYYEPLDHKRVEFLALSDDVDELAARAFADPMELPFPLFLGHGEIQGQLNYIGLPYTLIVDYRGRVVEEIYGFGSQESWDLLTSTLEREIERVTVTESGADAGHAGHEMRDQTEGVQDPAQESARGHEGTGGHEHD